MSIGIILAARLSDSLSLSKTPESGKSLSARLEADFKACGLPVECPYPLDVLAEAISKDKKSTGSKVAFVLPVVPGEVIIRELLPVAVTQLLDH